MRPLPKSEINEKDKDYKAYQVTLDGVEQRQDLVVSADASKGEVVLRKIDGDGNVLEKQRGQKEGDLLQTLTGFVLIQRRPVYEEPEEVKSDEPVPGETVDKTKPKDNNPAADPAAAGMDASAVTKETVKEAKTA